MNARVQGMMGFGDDTSMNGLMMACKYKNGMYPQTVMVYPGLWGTWRGWSKVLGGYFMCGNANRWEQPQGSGDDTAYNGLELKLCTFF